jgi:hypothetical protein
VAFWVRWRRRFPRCFGGSCCLGLHIYTHIHTYTHKPGPGGILGAAEGVAFLAVLAGVVVLGFQLADYGSVPNAVPTEGSRCQ